VGELHRRWIREGKVPPFPPGVRAVRVNTRTLPRECAVQVENILTARVRRVVEKANSQIKRTKEALRVPEAKGLLLLANDGDLMLELDGVLHCLHRILHGKYSHINAVAYFSANETVNGPGIPHPAYFWMPLSISDAPAPDRPKIDSGFLKRLSEAWFNHIATVRGMPVIAMQRGDDPPEVIERIRFGRPHT
jgi:hypothetical protein